MSWNCFEIFRFHWAVAIQKSSQSPTYITIINHSLFLSIMSLKIYHIIKVTLMSQHVQKATVQGFIAKITQKIHVLLANKHLKNAGRLKKNAEPCS